jgi:lipopolysaccharide/colanic/teichoic acid biosynthesis glycosyltransferase
MSMLVIIDSLLAEGRATVTPHAPPPATSTPEAGWYETLKVALDFVLAALILVLTAPLILMAIILIKVTSPGPAIYTQTRIGKNGRPFTIYKLRTMTHDCESLTGAQWSKPGDTRVTSVGRWLRRIHLDELPQLWNVIKGEMSLIGPRPERPEFLPQLEQAIPRYRDRLKVRPGVTGFAQVQLPPDTDFDSVRIKLAYDLFYVKTMNLGIDVRIYCATFLKIVGVGPGAIAVLCLFARRDAVQKEYERLTQPAS